MNQRPNKTQRPAHREPDTRREVAQGVLPRHDIHDFDDPYLPQQHLGENTVCPRCGAIYHNQRWTLDAAKSDLLLAAGTPDEVICPGCRKSADRDPQGILTLGGDYWPAHRDEILHLFRNEENEAMGKNPLGRIMGMREENGCLVIETTNEKLAQRLGRSLKKAHHGQVEYQWSEDNQRVRVEWERRLEKPGRGG
jgi:hypothetical protein